jgi:S-DNA-T family DNA segregation ATPase FtsK/SpoIIIE
MAARHRELISELRSAVGYARGAARAAVAAAERRVDRARAAHAEAEEEQRREVARLRAERERRQAEADRRCLVDLRRAATELTQIAAEQAPGAAGAPFSDWHPTAPARDRLPGLYRVGHLRLSQAAGGPVDDHAPPALVSLLDQAHLVVMDPAGRESDVQGVISTVLLRVLGSTPPGQVRLSVYDPEQLGGSLPAFAPLASAGLLNFVGPGGLGGVLDELVEQIRRINETVLAGEYKSLRELAAATGRRPEPWRVAVLLGNEVTGDTELSEAQRAQLDRVVRTGPACGVHLIVSGVGPVEEWRDQEGVEGVVLFAEGAWTTLTGNTFPVELDPPPPTELITRTCRAIADRVLAGPEPAVFADLLPEQPWTRTSEHRLVAPIGEGPDGRLVEVELGDSPPHALIGGPSGSGKTNLLYAWIGALAARYGPDDLAMYLLDFKEGVSFARFAPGRRDPTWLPQVRLVGVNVNSDREYGLALLAFLHEQLRRRAEAAKAHEATKLSELRAEDPDGHWPRIVAIIDEFQVLLDGRDPVALEAARLLEDLARRGRSQGIHLVLASQDLSGIDALWGRASMVAQFTLRIALPKARRLLAPDNNAADVIPRYHAVVNPDSGAEPANRVVRIPDAGSRGTLDTLQRELWEHRPIGLPEPVLFDGDKVPRLLPLTTPTDQPDRVGSNGRGGSAVLIGSGRGSADFARLGPPEDGPAPAPVALLGQSIDVGARAARLRLTRAPGRNLAVLGTRAVEACDVLTAATLSLARQHRPGTARFSLACLDDDAVEATKLLLHRLRAAGHADHVDWCDRDGVRALLADSAAEVTAGHAGTAGPQLPHYLVLYAVDAASTLLARTDQPAGTGGDNAGTPPDASPTMAAGRPASRITAGRFAKPVSARDHLQELVAHGPELRTHVIAWWRSVPRLRDDLGGVGARLDGFGAWVALDVQGSELSPLYTQPGGPAWYPRTRRALYFDRAVHRRPQVIIPYDTSDGTP